jgi:predicted alpha/beta hydrolase family esterase
MKKLQYFIITKSIGFYLNLLSLIDSEKAKTKAYKLFSQPRKGRYRNGEITQSLKTAQREKFHFDNEEFSIYKWDGNRTVVFLIHGWESNSGRWKKALPYFKKMGFTIIAIDGPAHGLSTGKEFNAPRYAAFINVVAQHYQPKHLVGHSVGGVTISYYLYHFENTVEKAVLLGAPSEFKLLSDNFVKLLSLNNTIKSKLENYYQEKFSLTIDEFSGHKFANKLEQKAFIVHDIGDKIVAFNESEKYHKSWKNSIYKETKGLGHSLQSGKLYTEIVHFLES